LLLCVCGVRLLMRMSQPSGRPKTSAGSRASSARGVRRPSTAARSNEMIERPFSRTAVDANSNVMQRSVSNAAVPPPRSSMGERIQGRMSTAQAARSPSPNFHRGAAPGSAMRPITQQGLIGVRASGRLTSSRQVLDKSYYVSLLQQKTNALLLEIDALKKELHRSELNRQNLTIYEKKAEEEASIIRDLQGTLADCNMIIDRLNTNTDLDALKEELNELIAKNEEAEKGLNELFADREHIEEATRDVEKQIELEKTKNIAALNELDVHIREQFEQLKRGAVLLDEEYHIKEEELDALNRRKEQLDDEVASSSFKQQAMILHERIAEMESKKAAITEEINAEGTPSEQRERLLQTVIRTTDEVTAMQKQIDSVTERIDQGNEELREFESEYDDVIGEKNEKYRELKTKEVQIDEFLDSYEELKSEQEVRIAQFSAEIVRLLELISRNCSITDLSANVTGMDTAGVEKFNDETAIASELQDLHVRLQEEMISLDESERRLRNDAENLTHVMQAMSSRMDEFEDHESLRADTGQKRLGLERRLKELQVLLPDVEVNNKQVLAKLSTTKAQLDENDEYTTLKNVQKKWQYIEQNNATLRETATTKDAETNYSNLKDEAMRLQAEYNANVVSWTRPK
uniref:Intraflagellar transport protein 74 n=1 Tax=Parascaris univalens TaxID=6257 RepID=A0A915AL91_PARUN